MPICRPDDRAGPDFLHRQGKFGAHANADFAGPALDQPGNNPAKETLRSIVRKQENTMLKSTVTIAFALALSMLPATAQQTKPDTAPQQTLAIGMPIYSSDGEKLGEVTQVGMHEGRHAVVAQLEPSVSGAKVLIPTEMMRQHENDRLELSMTAAEVRNTISKP